MVDTGRGGRRPGGGGRQPGGGETTLVVASETQSVLERLSKKPPEAAVLVTCERAATALIEAWRRVVGNLTDVSVLVVGDEVRSVSRSEPPSGLLGNAVRTVSSYSDTAAITSAVSSALADLRTDDSLPTLYVESLTAFERKVSLSRLIQTVGALTSTIEETNGQGHFLLDPTVDGDIRRILGGIVSETVVVGTETHESGVDGTPSEPSVETIFTLLTSAERRFILQRLAVADAALPVEDVVHELAAFSGFDGLDRAWTALYHVHFPPLIEAGVISLDGDDTHLSPGNAFERVHEHLRRQEH